VQKFSLLISDVDGTLVTENKILTARAQAAVAALRTRGILFAITSGRPPRGMGMLIGPLAITSPIAGFNGGALVRPDLSVINTRTLTPDVARQAIEVIRGHGIDTWLYTNSDWLIHNENAPHVAREAWTVKFEPTVIARFSDSDLNKVIKIVGVSDDSDAVAKCEADVSAMLGEHASVKRSQPYYVDITHPAANKGAVLDELVKMYGIPAAEVATIGDMPNDVLMFRRSGFSIAMGNASGAVKSQASATTDSFNDEGFAKAVERYLLNSSVL